MTHRPIMLALELEHGRTTFEPGERVGGVASWSVRVVPSGMELRLIRVTDGPGGRDVRIAETIPFGEPLVAERRPFTFALPTSPYSFQGGLMSLVWTLVLVAQPGEEKAVVQLTIAPERRPIDIRSADVRP